jgi:hypothetical protein
MTWGSDASSGGGGSGGGGDGGGGGGGGGDGGGGSGGPPPSGGSSPPAGGAIVDRAPGAGPTTDVASSHSSMPSFPLPPSSLGTSAAKANPLPLGRMLGNRDWVLFVECHNDGILLKYGNQKFTLQELSVHSAREHPLTSAVRQIIARRQATVAPGETPYRPILRFQVWPDGLQAYYLSFPLLQDLQVAMVRENIEPSKEKR